jgi:diguanylate cyclase (GGDEF)-like protein
MMQEHRKQLAEIERRSWQLWGIALLMTGTLAFGILLLVYPVLAGYARRLELERRNLPQLAYGMLTLVILSGTYIVLKQRELNALRNFIVASYASAALTKEDYPHDPLTGLLDRSALPDLLKNESARADRSRGPFCVAIFDIHGFRMINEREGNLVGDLVLKEFALTLQRTIRQSDSVLRYGPDEFLCLLVGTPRAGGDVFVRRVEKGCEHVARLQGLTFTAGLSARPAGVNPEEVVAHAEVDLRQRSLLNVSTTSSPTPA